MIGRTVAWMHNGMEFVGQVYAEDAGYMYAQTRRMVWEDLFGLRPGQTEHRHQKPYVGCIAHHSHFRIL